MEPVIRVEGVKKRYEDVEALRGVSLTIKPGDTVAIIGPNGAGKTTLIECMIGLRKPDAGSITILGVDVLKDPDAIKERIGVQLQVTSLFDKIYVDEALQLYSAYYKRNRPIEEIVELLELGPYMKRHVRKLSGGWRQRVALALALVNDPEVLFLDEPSTGLDPLARRGMWEIIGKLKAEKKTCLLSTHYMEEAQKLSDKVALVSAGEILAFDSPEELIKQYTNGEGNLDDVYVQLANKNAPAAV